MTNPIITRTTARNEGLKFYNTGNTCIKGHFSQRRTSTTHCTDCEKIVDKEFSKKFYQKNKEKIKAQVNEYRIGNIDLITKKKKIHYEENKEQISLQQLNYRNSLPKEVTKERNKKYYKSLSPEKIISERERLRIHNRKKYWENPELLRKRAREFQAENPEKTKARLEAWKKVSQSKIKEYRQRPYVKEQAKFLAGRRRAIKLQAIPIWADLELIELIYENCPVGLHVDHIVPLVSKFVCGLHCEANLRYLTPFENMSKGNRHWPDMP